MYSFTKFTFCSPDQQDVDMTCFFLLAVILIPEQTDRSFFLGATQGKDKCGWSVGISSRTQLAQFSSKTINISIS